MHTDLENLKLSGNFEKPQKGKELCVNFVRGQGNFSLYCVLVPIFSFSGQPCGQDLSGNISPEKLGYFDLDFLRNSP